MRVKKQKNYSILGDKAKLVKIALKRVKDANERKGKVYKDLAKLAVENPGQFIRRTVAGAQKNPLKTAIDVAATASPVPGTRVAMIAGNDALEKATRRITGPENLKKFRKKAKRIRVGEPGNKIEYYTNKAYLGATNFATNLSRMLPV